MNNQFPWLTFILLAAGGLIVSGYLQGGGIAPPAPTPDAPVDCPNLQSAFAKTDNIAEAKAHAHAFATMCGSFADIVEQDGHLPKPRLTRGVQLDDLRLAMRQMRMKGWSFSSKYADLPQLLESYLISKVGNDGGPLNDGTPDATGKTQRQKWVEAYRSLSRCAEHASQTL